MKKKIIIALFIILVTVGCTPIKNKDILTISNEIIAGNIDMVNEHRTGYKYYLPRTLKVIDKTDYNEKLASDNYYYYLYVDVISYYNNAKSTYKENTKAYYSKAFKVNDLEGYIEIKKLNNKYLVEIMYNYAKIEVVVYERDIKTAVANSVTILSSLKYNKDILENLIGENVLNFNETEFNIFETKKVESNYLYYETTYGQYDENEVPDSDLIN